MMYFFVVIFYLQFFFGGGGGVTFYLLLVKISNKKVTANSLKIKFIVDFNINSWGDHPLFLYFRF